MYRITSATSTFLYKSRYNSIDSCILAHRAAKKHSSFFGLGGTHELIIDTDTELIEGNRYKYKAIYSFDGLNEHICDFYVSFYYKVN